MKSGELTANISRFRTTGTTIATRLYQGLPTGMFTRLFQPEVLEHECALHIHVALLVIGWHLHIGEFKSKRGRPENASDSKPFHFERRAQPDVFLRSSKTLGPQKIPRIEM